MSAECHKKQHKYNNTHTLSLSRLFSQRQQMPSLLSKYDSKFYLAADICFIFRTVHTGICGYMCLARAFGFRDWKDVIRHLIEVKDDPILTSTSKDLIERLEKYMERHNWNCDGLDTSLYVNCDLRK